MKEKKQLECHLHCKSSACLNDSIALDMESEDRPIKELLENGKEETKDNQKTNS